MADRSEVIANYIAAKDCNRPWLMQRAFAKNCRLEMVVKTDVISFPSGATGINEITDTLVRKFSCDNENIYTFCLSTAPEGVGRQFSCDWLVGMSLRDSGDFRVGCGQYDWVFEDGPQNLASNLKITIEVMVMLAHERSQPLTNWLSGLDYPWCPADTAVRDMPVFDGLQPISDFLGERVARQ